MNDTNAPARSLALRLGRIKSGRRRFPDGMERDVFRIPEPTDHQAIAPASFSKHMRPSEIALTRWQDLEPHEQAAVLKLQVSARQVEFAGSVERAVATCEEDKLNDVAGLAIRVDESVVGFLVLKRRSKLPEWATSSAVVVSAMRIDRSHQGKGLGAMSLLALTEWVAMNWPESLSLALSVDEENVSGIRAYEKAGFRDQGMRVQGRIGWVRYMSKSIRGAH